MLKPLHCRISCLIANTIFLFAPGGAAAGHPGSGAAASASGGAVGGQDRSNTPVNDKSFESEMMDEGLDLSHMSQSREVSMFAGPYLNISEEEVVLGKLFGVIIPASTGLRIETAAAINLKLGLVQQCLIFNLSMLCNDFCGHIRLQILIELTQFFIIL